MINVNIFKTLLQACWVLLLALYGAASLKVDSFHELFHAQELSELHSPEHESDPCHKSVYHQAAEKGCEHRSHITENTKCPLCEFHSASDELLTTHVSLEQKKPLVFLPMPAFASIETQTVFARTDRGPPTII